MRSHISVSEQRFKLIIIVIFAILGVYSCAEAQYSRNMIRHNKLITRIGFEASFGVRSFVVNSDISKINQMHAVQEGGSLGVVAGNKFLKAKLKVAGFFTSNSNTPYTQEVYESSANLCAYPLSLMKRNKSKIQPYITGGVVRDGVKFYGTYLDQTPETGYEPYLGKVVQYSAQGGVGIEYQLSNNLDFIHFFAEAKYRTPISLNSSDSDFKGTSLSQFSSMSFGVSFGRRR